MNPNCYHLGEIFLVFHNDSFCFNLATTISWIWIGNFLDSISLGWWFSFERMFALSSSSSSCRVTSTDISDPLSPPLPIVHRFRQVLRATPNILTELLYVGSRWSPWFCSAMWRGPLEYITYELVLTSPAVFCMSGSSNLNSFRDMW